MAWITRLGGPMKIKISIEGTDIKLALDPDSELEKLVLHELGDDISISRSHQMLVLRRRSNHVRTIEDGTHGAVERPEPAEPASPGLARVQRHTG